LKNLDNVRDMRAPFFQWSYKHNTGSDADGNTDSDLLG
jgi:hypothetical protein